MKKFIPLIEVKKEKFEKPVLTLLKEEEGKNKAFLFNRLALDTLGVNKENPYVMLSVGTDKALYLKATNEEKYSVLNITNKQINVHSLKPHANTLKCSNAKLYKLAAHYLDNITRNGDINLLLVEEYEGKWFRLEYKGEQEIVDMTKVKYIPSTPLENEGEDVEVTVEVKEAPEPVTETVDDLPFVVEEK